MRRQPCLGREIDSQNYSQKTALTNSMTRERHCRIVLAVVMLVLAASADSQRRLSPVRELLGARCLLLHSCTLLVFAD